MAFVRCEHWSKNENQQANCALNNKAPSPGFCNTICSKRTSISTDELPEVQAARIKLSNGFFQVTVSAPTPKKPSRFSSMLPPSIVVDRMAELAICKACEHSGFDAHACEALPDHSCKRNMAHVAALAMRKCPRKRF